MAEVIAVSPKGKRIEMTAQAAKSHRHLMSLQGQDGWQYLNGNGQAIASPNGTRPTAKRSEFTEDVKLKPTIEDVHSLMGDMYQKQNELLQKLNDLYTLINTPKPVAKRSHKRKQPLNAEVNH